MIFRLLVFSILFSLYSASALAQNEAARRRGFYQHKAEARQADIEREQGLREFLRDQAAWEEKRNRDRKADRLRKKEATPDEKSPEYKAFVKERLADYEEYEETHKKFLKEKRAHEVKDAKEVADREAWAMEEYGLDKKRPRYDIAKRLLYGKPNTGSSAPGGGSSFGGNPSFPENNYNNEFEGYVPPPPFPDPGGYFPPPDGGFAPPPAYPGGEDYYPPPPPPPAGFDNGF